MKKCFAFIMVMLFILSGSFVWAEGGNAGAPAGKRAETEERSSPSSGGFGGLLSGVMGSLGMNQSEQKAEEKGSSIFSSTIEVKSIETDSVPAGAFEIPGGYSKKGE